MVVTCDGYQTCVSRRYPIGREPVMRMSTSSLPVPLLMSGPDAHLGDAD